MTARDLTLLGISLALACGPSPSTDGKLPDGTSPGTAVGGQDVLPPSKAPHSVATELADQLTLSTEVAKVVDATERALARGGLSVADGTQVFVPAVAPAAGGYVPLRHVLNMAYEAHGRATMGRLTADDLGNMLRDLGWPMLPGSSPGEQIVALLAAWIEVARGTPDSPESFTPLFLYEMARRQQPGVDLLTPPVRPEALRLSTLELQLFAAAFDRAVLPSIATQSAQAAAASTGGPCGIYQGANGELVEKAGGTAVPRWIVGSQLETALERSGHDTEKFNTGMLAVGIAQSIWKAVLTYLAGSISLDVEPPSPVAKPRTGELFKEFTAKAGIRPDWHDYATAYEGKAGEFLQFAKECLGSLGMPVPADVADIAKGVEGWRIGWRLVEGSPRHAMFSLSGMEPPQFDFNIPPYKQRLRSTGPDTGEAKLKVAITKDLSERGVVKRARVTMRAEAYFDPPPDASMPWDVVLGQLTGFDFPTQSVVDLAVGWFENMFPLKTTASFDVTYHAFEGWVGVIYYEEVGSGHVDYSGWSTGSANSLVSLQALLTLDGTMLYVPNTGPIIHPIWASDHIHTSTETRGGMDYRRLKKTTGACGDECDPRPGTFTITDNLQYRLRGYRAKDYSLLELKTFPDGHYEMEVAIERLDVQGRQFAFLSTTGCDYPGGEVPTWGPRTSSIAAPIKLLLKGSYDGSGVISGEAPVAGGEASFARDLIIEDTSATGRAVVRWKLADNRVPGATTRLLATGYSPHASAVIEFDPVAPLVSSVARPSRQRTKSCAPAPW